MPVGSIDGESLTEIEANPNEENKSWERREWSEGLHPTKMASQEPHLFNVVVQMKMVNQPLGCSFCERLTPLAPAFVTRPM